jgi:hypothetical protein
MQVQFIILRGCRGAIYKPVHLPLHNLQIIDPEIGHGCG